MTAPAQEWPTQVDVRDRVLLGLERERHQRPRQRFDTRGDGGVAMRLREVYLAKLLETREDGRIKLYISHRLLCLRRERPELFVGASYTPLRGNQHVAAFSRGADGQTLWVCYSANHSDKNGPSDPPGSRYALSLHEATLLVA